MALGKSIRIYLADGSVSGVRHGEIVNWTGQAIACPRTRFAELKEWSEARRPGVYFLLGQAQDTAQDAVYIGEAEVVIERLYSHIGGKEFWTELVAFTSKDDNLTKGHVRYLESRLVQLAIEARRHEVQNAASPQLPSLPRSDRDAMEEFIEGVRTLLGVLGHRVLEPLVLRTLDTKTSVPASVSVNVADLRQQTKAPATFPEKSQKFQIRVADLNAMAIPTDEGLVVLAESEAASNVQPSLSTSYRALRDRLLSTGVMVPDGQKLRFTRDQLFSSPSQAAAVVVGYSINGRDAWRTDSGMTFADFEARLARGEDR